MRTIARLSFILCLLSSFLAQAIPNYSSVEPYQQQLTGRVRQGDTLLLRDEKFQNPVWNWSLIQNHKVSNEITFSLIKSSLHQIGKPFTAKVDLKVEYWSQPGQIEPFTEEHVKLEVKYDTARGVAYAARDVYRFVNGHKVKITVNSITSAELGTELPEIFTITSQVFVDRSYIRDANTPPVSLFVSEEAPPAQRSPGAFATGTMSAPQVNRVLLNWTAPAGAEHYDLEWTFVDETSSQGALLENTPPANQTPAFLARFFRNNATRVTLDEQGYNINLVHYTKYLLVRIRTVAVNPTTGIREEEDWVYDINFTPAGGSSLPVKGVIELTNNWHNSHLNWQYNATYAEEGKRKEVVSYFDKSLKNRQSVTLLNNGNVVAGTADVTTIAQSTIYDEYGRAALNVLPAPLFGRDVLTFYPQLNKKQSNGEALNFLDVSASGLGCTFDFKPLGTLDGAGRYYSPLNDYKSEGNHAFVPNAEGYPFSAQFYTNDNTGRISSQGGVGAAFQPQRNPSVNNVRSTRYFYSKPSQEELYRLFGNDVGYASHYAKNTVIDPNGQISVSYVNLSGKTIATALSGESPANLDALASKPAAVERTNTIFAPADFTYDPVKLKLEANQTYIAEQPGEFKFKLNIQKLVSKHTTGSLNICTECAYDIVVTATDDCMDANEKAVNTIPFSIQGTAPSITCTAQPNNLDEEFTLNFTNAGAYYVKVEIKLKEKLIREKADQYVNINTALLTQFNFIEKELDSLDVAGCFSDCKTCKTTLGTRVDFIQRIRDKMSTLGVNLTVNGNSINIWAGNRYDALYTQCVNARLTCADDPCHDLRTKLRADVSPGGQYALFSDLGEPLETDLNVLYLKWRTVFDIRQKTDANYMEHYVIMEGGDTLSVHDSTFTLLALVNYWKPEYADKFITYHPEYCGLQYCENNMAYLKWDDRITSMTETNADIVELIGVPFPSSNATWLVDKDPFFMPGAPGAGLKNAFIADLNYYSRNVKKMSEDTFVVKHLGQYVDYMLYCADNDGTTNNLSTAENKWLNCSPNPECRVWEREWQLYRRYYFELKQKYYQDQRNAGICSTSCKVGQPISVASNNCASTGDFSVTLGPVTGSNRRIYLDYTNGYLSKQTVVMLAVNAGVLGNTITIVSRVFEPGQARDSLDLTNNIFLVSTRVLGVYCAPAGGGVVPCNGTAFMLDLGTTGRKAGYRSWDGVAPGNKIRTFYVQTGLRDSLPNLANYCLGADTAYYNCLTIRYNGIEESYQNAWLITCPQVNCNPGGSFAATTSLSTLKFSNGTEAIEIVPFTASNSGVTSTLCASPTSSNWYECYTVTLGGYTYYFRNARVFVCPAGPPCVADVNYYYTTVINGNTVYDGQHSTYGKYYVMGSGSCPSGTTETIVSGATCVRFAPRPGTFGDDVYFQNTTIKHCESSSGGSLMAGVTPMLMPGGGTGTCPDGLQYKQSRLGEVNYNAQLDQQQIRNEGNADLVQYQQNVCANQADIWLERLDNCFAGLSASQKKLKQDALKAKLIELCNKGVDINHPHGASTLPSGVSIPGGNTSFKEVIKTILSITQLSPDCNPWLIDGPYPYNTPLLAKAPVISNSSGDICARLKKLKDQHAASGTGTFHSYLVTRFGAAMTLSATELAELELSCGTCRYILKKDIELPLFLAADTKGCVTKSEVTSAWTAVESEVAGLTTAHPEYERIVTNYLNHKWGFGLGYADYLNVKESTNPNFTLCNTPAFTSTPPDPLDCIMSQVHTAVINGLRSYDQYIEEVKRKFRQDYISACSKTQSGLKVTSTSIGTYHYTLYYYDQSGNLVKTVPPEGVHLLSDEGMVATNEVAKQDANCVNTGPQTDTDIELTKQYFNTSLNSGTHAIEMWLYNNEMPIGQVLVTSGVTGYMLNACMGEQFMDLDIYKLDGATGRVDIQRSRHFRVTMNKSALRPMMHVVLQGTNMGLDNGSLNVYVNGELRPASSDGTSRSACSWELAFENGQIKLPQNSAALRHVRGYNRALLQSEVTAQFNMACLGLSVPMANVPREHWGRLNSGAAGSPETVGNTTQQTKYAKVYPAHGLNSTYSFNSLNGVVAQETPDGGASTFWYDWIGRLVASRNAIQSGRASYTKYDDQGRIIEVGERAGGGWNKPFLTEVDVDAFLDVSTDPTTKYITKTFYDERKTGSIGLGVNAETIEANIQQDNLRKRVAATYAYDVYGGDPVATFYSYDMMGNVKSLLQKLPGLKFKKIDYSYDLASGKVRTVRYKHSPTSAFYYDYRYDAENRLIKAYSGIQSGGADGWSVINPKLEAAYYYYKHGPLSRMELGENVQGVDYAYTLQGWLKAINGESLGGTNDIGRDGVTGTPNAPFQKDVYGFTLQYFENDYKSVAKNTPADQVFNLQWAYNTSPGTGRQLFNGNIARTTIAMREFSGGSPVGYAYRYDQLNRLTQMQQHSSSGNSMSGANVPYAETVTYDANGNIQTYKRNGNKEGSNTLMDDLSYSYASDLNTDGTKKLLNNRLQKVSDAIGKDRYTGDLDGVQDYQYDAIGNLVSDKSNGVKEINWTVYGKIGSILKENGELITYKYDASGNRIYKDLLKNNQLNRTWYLRDAQGNSLALYGQKHDAATPMLEEQHLYGSSRLGVWGMNLSGNEPFTDNWDAKEGKTLYELTNHLGNVLATVSGQNNGDEAAEVASMVDYYPFGMAMPGRNISFGEYRYGFNGKENDNEVKGIEGGQQDYGMRIYDPRVGRFLSIDPLTYEYPYYSPYHFGGNSPIANIDLDGGEPKPSIEGTQEGQSTTTSEAQTKYASMGTGNYSYTVTKTQEWHWHTGSEEYKTKSGWYTTEDYQKLLKPVGKDIAAVLDLYNAGVFTNVSESKGRLANFFKEQAAAPEEFFNKLGAIAFGVAREESAKVMGFTYTSSFNVEDIVGVGLLLKAGLKSAGLKILGSAQTTGTLGHATTSKLLAWRYALDPRVERVTLDLGYKKLLGNPKAPFKYGPRPDVGVYFKNGTVRVFEVMSKTDVAEKLVRRNMVFMNRNNIEGTVKVFKPFFFIPK